MTSVEVSAVSSSLAYKPCQLVSNETVAQPTVLRPVDQAPSEPAPAHMQHNASLEMSERVVCGGTQPDVGQ